MKPVIVIWKHTAPLFLMPVKGFYCPPATSAVIRSSLFQTESAHGASHPAPSSLRFNSRCITCWYVGQEPRKQGFRSSASHSPTRHCPPKLKIPFFICALGMEEWNSPPSSVPGLGWVLTVSRDIFHKWLVQHTLCLRVLSKCSMYSWAHLIFTQQPVR